MSQKKYSKIISSEVLTDLLITQNKSITEICKIYECNDGNLRYLAKKYKISIPYRGNFSQYNILLKNKDEIIKLYETTHKLETVSEKINRDAGCVRHFFRSINYKYRTNNYVDLTPHISDIKRLYYIERKTIAEISKMYNCSADKLRTFLKKSGYLIRDKNSILQERNSCEIFQRKCMSSSGRLKSYSLPSGGNINLRGYEPQFLDFIFTNNLLEENEIVFKPERIKYEYLNKSCFYYPDFYIPKYNLIVEIKSSWILQKQGVEKTNIKHHYAKLKGYDIIMVIDNKFDEFWEKVKDVP